jgi:hypothetical protein
MANELVLVNGIWTLREATEVSPAASVVQNLQSQAYDYVAPLTDTTIRLTNFVETSASGSYT